MPLDIRLRVARASDTPAAVPLLYSAGPKAFEFLFGTPQAPARAFLDYAFAEGDGLFGHRAHWAAEVDGELAGIGAFYDGGQVLRLALGTSRQSLRFFGAARGAAVIGRMAQLGRIAPAPPRDVRFVADLGVCAAMRGRGIGTRMLAHQVGMARHRGKRFLGLDVGVDNPRAQVLYERLGFQVVHERHPPPSLAGRLVGCRRMLMPIPAVPEPWEDGG
jgi:ribosomal protein S18 acetylase RimI-like enzyme